MMELLTSRDFLQSVFMAGALYGAIRADLKYIRFRAEEAHKLAASAHARLNQHFERRINHE